MTEKRYYKKEYEEEYYIFDSKTLTEKEFEKKVEYDGYSVFADSLTPEEVLDLLNENEQLKKRNQELELENLKYIGEGEWDIRDITCMHGKFRLEEWGERYHQFYEGNKQLEDEEVVSLLFENEELKKENEELKKEKYQAPFLKIFKDYFIYYNDATFSMHKPKDIRDLCFLLNKEHGFTELQCEYNDEEMKE